MTSISVALKVRNEMDFLPEVLEQVEKFADEIIVVVDSRSFDGTFEFIEGKEEKDSRYKMFARKFDNHTEQKNYAREQCTKDWILFLDGDEILSDNCDKMKQLLEKAEADGCDAISFQGHHFIYSLATEDAVNEIHWWRARCFKNLPEIKFEGINHEITVGFKKLGLVDDMRIFHMGYVRHLTKIPQNVKENIAAGLQIHTLTFLENWKNAHLLGGYPVRTFDLKILPSVLKKKFLLENIDDILYFANRDKPELKHLVDAFTWKDYFKPRKVLEVGCGMGPRVFAMDYAGMDAYGFDISKWAIENTPFIKIKDKMQVWDVTRTDNNPELANVEYDLVVCYDVLEHIPEEKLNDALRNIFHYGSENYIFSVPFLGDPNLENDATHQTKQPREWWENKIRESGFEIVKTPEKFLFPDQLIIARRA